MEVGVRREWILNDYAIWVSVWDAGLQAIMDLNVYFVLGEVTASGKKDSVNGVVSCY